MTPRPAFLVGLFSISVSVFSCGSSSPGTGSAACTDLMSYTASSSTPVTFATDILPILQDPGASSTGPSCAAETICHGSSPVTLNSFGAAQKLSFIGDAATVKAALLSNSVNAPSQKRVVPGNVGQSFLAYKISGQDALSCSNLSCVSGASVGTHKPCGDAMPTAGIGMLTDAQHTKILDWIAQGAN